MSDDTRPPHPGAAPEPFDFPFAEARAARDAAEELAQDLRQLRTTHADARGHVEDGVFEGRTADTFRTDFDGLMDQIDGHVTALEGQVDDIDTDIAVARQRVEEYEAAWWHWHAAHEVWANWTPPVGTATN